MSQGEQHAAKDEHEDDSPSLAVCRRPDAPALCIVSNLGVAQTEQVDDAGHPSSLRHDGAAQTLLSAGETVIGPNACELVVESSCFDSMATHD